MSTEPMPSYHDSFRWRFEDIFPLRDAIMNWRSVTTVKDVSLYQIKRITQELFDVIEQVLPEWTEVIAHGEAQAARITELETELATLKDEQGHLKPRIVERWAHCECESEDYGLAMIVRQVHDDSHADPWQICANQACRAASGTVA